ncbi:S41 family peptidase [Prevotella sp. KH2C16]|uniref:S41 family peptidase n=1 Tax=Prevotella sp. KH2C16 TaxID=1855325 RepID=UPI0008E150F1|nr:S41 family peptidase [Prevotella sp. KH2C16]SFG51535.1 C-terminal processing protease CtpA/Prc, contains a PDZ domain [Prevotella sp. KH2C16]
MKRKNLLRSILLFLLVVCTIKAQAQDDSLYSIDNPSPELRLKSGSLLSRKQAVFDIESLIYNLSEIHPNLFSVCGQGAFLQMVNQIEAALPDSLSTLQLYKAIQPLVVRIGDGHTSLFFPYNDAFKKDTPRIPLSLEVGSDNAVTVSFSLGNKIPEGAQILAINDVTARQMIERMLDYESGESQAFRMQRVRNDFPALFFLLYSADSYKIEYKEPGGGKPRRITLAPCPNHELFALKKQREKRAVAAPESYSFRLLSEDKVAVMDFKGFNDPERMKVFADSMFTTLRENNIHSLIIDITENGGGNSEVGDILFRYISPRPFNQFGKELARVTPTTQRLMDWKQNVGWYYMEVQDSDMIRPLTEKEGHFKGRVYLLTSNRTFSSASSFAWAFKVFGMGKVIGEETGGMNVCFGDVLMYRLPVSGLKASVSYKRFWQYGADENDIHGTLPDYEVPKDEALARAIEIAKRL